MTKPKIKINLLDNKVNNKGDELTREEQNI